jgi:hypothetical protein
VRLEGLPDHRGSVDVAADPADEALGQVLRAAAAGASDDLREGYPLIAVDPRPWVTPRPTPVVNVLWAGG